VCCVRACLCALAVYVREYEAVDNRLRARFDEGIDGRVELVEEVIGDAGES